MKFGGNSSADIYPQNQQPVGVRLVPHLPSFSFGNWQFLEELYCLVISKH